MTKKIFSKTDLSSNKSFKALTSYCETLHILSFSFDNGKVILSEEKPIYNATTEMIKHLPQYLLTLGENRLIESLNLRRYDKEKCMNGSQFFTETYCVVNKNFKN
jgi:hypothetical protein